MGKNCKQFFFGGGNSIKEGGEKVTLGTDTAEENKANSSILIGNIIKTPLSESHQGQAPSTSEQAGTDKITFI